MSRNGRAISRPVSPLFVVAVFVFSLCPFCASVADPPTAGPATRPVAVGEPNLLIILDSSDSMSRNDPEALRILAAQIVLALAGPRENIGIVAFSDDARVLVPLQSVDDPQSRGSIRTDVEELRSGGFTNYSAALRLGADLLKDNPDAPTTVIFLSDGRNNRGGSGADVLKLLGQSRLGALHAIAFRDTAETGLLRDMAVSTGGTYSLARKPLELLETFQTVARNFWPYVWIKGRNTATIFPSARKIAFIAERVGAEKAILDVTLNDESLPADLARRTYAYPPADAGRRRPIEIWTLDDPPMGRYTAHLAPGAGILAVLQRLPFAVDFVPGRPKSLYREDEDDAIEIAVRIGAANPDLVAGLQQAVSASVALADSASTELDSQPVTPDPAGGASFHLTAVHRPIDFASSQRERAVDVIVTLKLKDPSAPADPEAVWTKNLRKTIILRRLQKGIVTIGAVQDKPPPLKLYPSALDFGAVSPPDLPQALYLEVTNMTSETINVALEAARPAVGDLPASITIRTTRPDLGDQEIDSLTVLPDKTVLVRVSISIPEDLPDGDYHTALVLSWTPPGDLIRVLEVPTRLSVSRRH